MQDARCKTEDRKTKERGLKVVKIYKEKAEFKVVELALWIIGMRKLTDKLISAFPTTTLNAPEVLSPLIDRKKGGIDFNPNKLDIKKQWQGINFNVPVDIQAIQPDQINGFSPVIFQIIPANLPALMGIG